METVETVKKAETVETNIPAYTTLQYSKEVFHMKVINIFNCQHVGVSMIKLNKIYVKIVKTVETVETAETVETVETMETVETVKTKMLECRPVSMSACQHVDTYR